jgi:DNA-binding transcriptional regulator LsrR (DeoR family)
MPQEKGGGPAALLQAVAAARRYYLDGASKSAIAAELGVSRFKPL